MPKKPRTSGTKGHGPRQRPKTRPREGSGVVPPTAPEVVLIEDNDDSRRSISPSATAVPDPRPAVRPRPAEMPIRRRGWSFHEQTRPNGDASPMRFAAPLAPMTPREEIPLDTLTLPTIEIACAEAVAAASCIDQQPPLEHIPGSRRTHSSNSPPHEPEIHVIYRVTTLQGEVQRTRIWFPPCDLADMSFDDMLREIPLKLKNPWPGLLFILTDDVNHIWEELVVDLDSFELMKRQLQKRREDFAGYVGASRGKWFSIYVEEC
ncbi:hypothetical protein B0T11DRAFT_277558 [Plectosphaerella cucumerina]|uniref:Uncharacterized protein n=1 Tax=Plectosphaerella cucumerina TaxID=40658 RepID=A0A8K0TNB1_9PEZI|nr:hypothetical protein B0T11DRAFT_277558 [Plectosphaerella cucumerina]